MNAWHSFRAALCAAAVLLLVTASAAIAPPDRKAPTRPTNLRVTATTAWSVSLAWNASTDNSGQFSYWVRCSNGQSVNVPQASTSVTFTSGFQHQGTYSFFVYAVDAAGNTSQNSNTVSATLPRDTTPPEAPEITLTNVGPTHAVLAWSAIDDGPFLHYALYKDGVLVDQPSSATSRTLYLLEPETTYIFTARALDRGGNWSPMSEPLVVTTEAVDQDDKAPPTPPTNLWATNYGDGSTEFEVRYTASTDNITPQEYIRYDLYVNGQWLGVTVGRTKMNDHGVVGDNVIEVTATDTAGNVSEAARIVIHLP